MTVILVTGMSGVGKSVSLGALERRGYRVVDTDVGGWTEHGDGMEPQWHEGRIDALITEHARSDDPLFFAGTVWNQGAFYPRFDEVVLLTSPLQVMLDRIANRDTNHFGKTTEERDRIVADTMQVEPLLRASATVELDTRLPLAEVVDRLEALVDSPRPR